MSSKVLDKLATRIDSQMLQSVGHMIAGGTAGAIALSILYPLEQLGTRSAVKSSARLITPASIVSDFVHLRLEHIADIYRGLWFGIFEKFTFNGIYFFFYSLLKHDWKRRYATAARPEMSLWVALLRGSLAGILTQLFTSPLGTIQKILQTTHGDDEEHRDAAAVLANVVRKHGVSALWSGMGMSTLLVVNPAINVYCYEHLRKGLHARLALKSAAIDFAAGLASKATATLLCYPLILVKYNQQADTQRSRKRSAAEIVRHTMRESGLPGFYKGMSTKLVQSSLNNALMFMIKERVVIYTFAVMLYVANKRKRAKRMLLEKSQPRARQ